ncbi:uncharacterized protein At3g27210 isoform X2 [Phoenix dactylifera]|uniref:Uncharacterized protein At3g27210 isoform X2 n=1 Tax=Phoenix dactylifera TaxID=42345 RepID=A0A8B8ZJH2_PHODC|nr:uncharacterized protein At3g27210 isoform X2 [Phoenix dactylifera]
MGCLIRALRLLGEKTSSIQMGSCASVQKNPDTAMGFRLGLGSKAKKVFIPCPAKEKPLNGENPVGGFDFKGKVVDSGLDLRNPVFGSKEEIFFDSRAWLDSDCEDDFYSVNGEFTPSRGSTPNYQITTPATPRLNDTFFIEKFSDSKSEPSPTGRKKLAELLRESSQGEKDVKGQNASDREKVEINGKPDGCKINSDQPPKSLDGTPYFSGANSVYSSEVTPTRDPKNRKKRTWKSAHCCLPSLVQSFSFDERRQKMSQGPCAA